MLIFHLSSLSLAIHFVMCDKCKTAHVSIIMPSERQSTNAESKNKSTPKTPPKERPIPKEVGILCTFSRRTCARNYANTEFLMF